MWLRKKFRVMQEAGVEGGGGAGGDTGADGSGANDAAAAAAADQAAGGEGQGAPAQASALKAGEQAPDPTPAEFIPEKFHVKNEAGDLDIAASARKMAESYGHLEKKAGTGDAPPKSADDYTFSPPEALKDLDLRADPEMKSFLDNAQKAGLTQAQMDLVMGEYFRLAPQLAQGAAVLDQEAATAALKEVWATDSDFKRNSHLAYTATSAAIERSGVTMQEVEDSGLGNHPVFLRLMAGLGAEFQEDKATGSVTHKAFGKEDVQALELSEAYRNPKHPDHERVSKQVKAWYDRTYGTEAAA